MKYCPKCGNPGSNNDRVCGHCGEWLTVPETNTATPSIPMTETTAATPPETPKRKGGKGKIIALVAAVFVLIAAVAVLIMTHVICLSHAWEDATCTEPKSCRYCGKTEGKALGHKYQDATCTTPQTCSVCKQEQGEPGGHEWQDATCTEAKICIHCGTVEGEALGHTDGEWVETEAATLVDGGMEEMSCAVCGEKLDSRSTDEKKPAVEGMSFNFTDAELVEWLNEEGMSVDEEPIEVEDQAEENTTYVLRIGDDTVLLIMNHGDNGKDGNVCAIVAYSGEEEGAGFAALTIIAERIDSRFVAEDAVTPVLLGKTYTKGGMSVLMVDDYTILGTEDYIDEIG